MSSLKITSAIKANNIHFKGNETKPEETKTPTTDTKNGKKKLVLALAGLAAIGVTALAIAKHGKVAQIPGAADNNKAQNGLNEAADTVKEKIKGLIKKEDLPFDGSTKTILDKENNKIAMKNTHDKYSAQYNGKDVVVEEKFIGAKNLRSRGHYGYAFIKDPETGKTLEIKRLTLEGNEITPEAKKFTQTKKAAVDNILKTAEKTVDENGNKVTKTYKNGKLHSIQTTIINPDNSRQIIIEYGDNGSKGYKKIINIAADGTKKVTEEGKRLFDL